MKYIHMRFYEKNGNPTRFGGITVAYKIEKTESNTSVAACSVARCSLSDPFNKRLGREIAQGRWIKCFDKREQNHHSFMIPLLDDSRKLIPILRELVMK